MSYYGTILLDLEARKNEFNALQWSSAYGYKKTVDELIV